MTTPVEYNNQIENKYIIVALVSYTILVLNSIKVMNQIIITRTSFASNVLKVGNVLLNSNTICELKSWNYETNTLLFQSFCTFYSVLFVK